MIFHVRALDAAVLGIVWCAWRGWGFRHFHVPRIQEKAMKTFEGVDVPVR